MSYLLSSSSEKQNQHCHVSSSNNNHLHNDIIDKEVNSQDLITTDSNLSVSNKEIQNINSNDADSSSFSLHIKKKSKPLETYLAIVCVIAGSGVLALPKAISESGLISIALLITNFLVAWYTGNLNIKCLYYDRPRRLDSLPSIGYEAFGIFGKGVVLFAHYAIILGGASIYILTAGINICDTIAENYSFIKLYEKWFIFGCGLFVMLVYCSAKTLKEAAWMSVLGALTTAAVVIIIIIASGIDISTTLSHNKNLSVDFNQITFAKLPSTLATASFAYGGAVVFPHIELTMKNRRNWSKLLFLALLTVCFMYFIVSFFGVVAYGKHVRDYVYNNFSLKPLRIISRAFMTCHVLLAAPVYMCSFGIETENYFNLTVEKFGKKKEMLIRFAIRSVQVMILTGIVMILPKFKAFVGLIGALANGLIIFIVPIVCCYKLFGFRNIKVYMHFLNALILATGVICVIFGTISAIEEFKNK